MHLYTLAPAADVSLVAATAKTVVQLVTGATRRAKITGLELGFTSTTSTDGPVLVQLMLQTTAGTMSALTPRVLDQSDPAAISTAQSNASAEPTASTVFYEWRITPIGGQLIRLWPFGFEFVMNVSSKVGIVMTAPQNQTTRLTLTFQE